MLIALCVSSGLSAQCPGPAQRTALINLQRANAAEGTRAGQIPLTDTCGNQRYAQYVEINLDTINYTPSQTGNLNNLSEFVITLTGDLWYIDWQGNAVQFQAGSGSCDEDWLEITTNTCPDNILDSIYTQRYAAIGARLVWPTAELLVSDSTGVGLTVISGNRNARLGLYDNFNSVYSTIDQSGTSTIWYIDPTGEMRWTTAGGGTVQSPGAPFVNQFAIDPNDTPVPTLQAYLYPNTRTDTATVRNFLYTDPVGKIRSQAIDTLVQIVVDSIQADTTLQRNWYTHNGVTTDLGRTAFVKRSAWWRGLDTLGFMRFTMRPTLFTGTQFTVYNDSTVWDYINASGVRNLVSIADTGIILATAEDFARSINFWTDTVNWSSSFDPALQIHNLRADGTYFYADSLKVVALGQFPGFPSLVEDGTEKGYFYDPADEKVVLINGNGVNGEVTSVLLETNQFTIAAEESDRSIEIRTGGSTNSNNLILSTEIDNPEFGINQIIIKNSNGPDNNGVYLSQEGTNDFSQWGAFMSIGRGWGGVGNRAYTISLNDGLSNIYNIVTVLLPNDTTEDVISFYNRAYYWKNEMPTGAVGDTLFHYWAEDGVNAGKNPGFMTLDDIRGSGVNWYNANGTTTDNTRIATVTETATWLSDDVVVDGVYPFRFELAGSGANEPEMMVWKFPTDSATLYQSDQEITFFANNFLLLKSDQAVNVQADSFAYLPNLGGVAFRVGENNVITQNAPNGSPTHKDAIEYNSITGTAQTELFLDGGSAVWVIPTNSAQNFKIHISAICSAAGNGVGINTGDAFASWHLGGIKRIGSTTSLVGSVQTAATAQSDAGMSTSVVTIDADDTDESLRIRFTPPSTAGSSTVIQVTATIEISQTSY